MDSPAVSTVITLLASDLPGANARARCRACPSRSGYLARYIQVNGAIAVRWVCVRCEDYKTAGDLPRTILGAVDVDALPLRRDNSVEERQYDPCVVCGDDALHQHHWAPLALFPDWPYGLVQPLCISHHDEWHQTMRAHGLRWPGEQEAA